MSWLNEGDTTYRFRCLACDEITHINIATEVDQDIVRATEVECEHCKNDVGCVYAGFEPRTINQMTKITFEKNGRVGVKVVHGDGKIAIRSKTKDNYLQGKKCESVLTKGCEEASNKAKQKIVHDRVQQWKNEEQRRRHEN